MANRPNRTSSLWRTSPSTTAGCCLLFVSCFCFWRIELKTLIALAMIALSATSYALAPVATPCGTEQIDDLTVDVDWGCGKDDISITVDISGIPAGNDKNDYYLEVTCVCYDMLFTEEDRAEWLSATGNAIDPIQHNACRNPTPYYVAGSWSGGMCEPHIQCTGSYDIQVRLYDKTTMMQLDSASEIIGRGN